MNRDLAWGFAAVVAGVLVFWSTLGFASWLAFGEVLP